MEPASVARPPARQLLAWLARTQPPRAEHWGFRARLPAREGLALSVWGRHRGGSEYWGTTTRPAVGEVASVARLPARQLLAWLARTQPPRAEHWGFRARL